MVWVVPALALAGACSGPVVSYCALAAPMGRPTRSGSIVVKVASYKDERRPVPAAALGQGAEMLGARTLVDVKGRRHGWLRLRLPSPRLPALPSAGGAAGSSTARTSRPSITLRSMRNWRGASPACANTGARLSGVLSDGRRLRGEDLLYVQERPFRASVDESLLAQRQADLERDAQVNAVQIEMFESGILPPTTSQDTPDLTHGFIRAAGLARAHLDRLLARGATAGAYALIYAPLWLPTFLAALLLHPPAAAGGGPLRRRLAAPGAGGAESGGSGTP